ncbi:MAG TPA: PSD1 and planctomycete cytochrome C domain-containing protein [Verrucomicrobiae bacterium]|nr:PSD1 and planctomycete cytochrome C domain-containing protein [Verrucomicrobiae bacterium]
MPVRSVILSAALCFVGARVVCSAAQAIDFNRDIRPIISDNCVACHGPDKEKRKAGLRLDEEASSRAELKSGNHAIVPGKLEESALVARITTTDEDDVMPPLKSNKKLTAAQIEKLKAWIAGGGKYAQHWSFVKPERPALPQVKDKAWVRTPIDLFILARLEKEGIAPSAEADSRTLLRRASLDVTGLLPVTNARQESRANPQVRRPAPQLHNAWGAVIDELLASPHYGERWGRHWLDMARYADSNGYSIDAPRTIWKYRDWVIDAFNADMPFDEFTIEQLAGDLLPNATADQKVATGFHRNTQINQEGGIDEEQFRIESVVDRVNTTGSTWLGLTLGCAQCHDHKFDPITQREYYEIFAFLNNQDEPNLALGTEEESRKLEDHNARIKELEDQIREQEKDLARFTNEVKKATAQLAKLKKSTPKVTSTMVFAERKKPRESYIHVKGDFTRHGDPVEPGVLQAVLAWKAPERPMGTGRRDRRTDTLELPSEANRLDLARWLVHRENPLTARVLVNRIWLHYFGRGLVETENDFGSQGAAPTHPELLDWLAVELMENGWSQKHIHRLILNSATYRQSSNARPDLANIDANNYLLARQNRIRLDAEVVRDVGLAASGLFTEKIGGPSVFPPQPDGVMTLGQSRREWKASEGADRYRRGMYTFFWRATPHPSLTVFDAPDAFSACTRRARSNTPLQSLTLLNDRAQYEFAQALAERLLKEEKSDEARIRRGFQYCLSRLPTEAEEARVKKLLATTSGEPEKEAWTVVARVLLNLDETITRE